MKDPTPHVIFFDYDGVLTTDKSGLSTTYRYLSRASGVPESSIGDAFGPYVAALLTGKLGHADIWPALCAAWGTALDRSLLADAFASTPVNERMWSLARRLRAGHALGIITDNTHDRMRFLRAHQGLDAVFDPIVVSADVGCTKHGEDIFVHAASCAGVAPQACVFIDNSEANVAVARSAGMRAVFHDDDANDVDALAAELQGLGVRLDGC